MMGPVPPQAAGALLLLLQAAEEQVGDFSGDRRCGFDRLALDALREAGALAPPGPAESSCSPPAPAAAPAAHASALLQLLTSFGWNGTAFPHPFDARCLASRLKALLFEGLRQLGSGSYSVVYRARHKVTGGAVTLKKLRLDRSEEGVPSTAVREVSLLRELAGCPHIVQ